MQMLTILREYLYIPLTVLAPESLRRWGAQQ